jgi:hypothetical protein
MVDPRSLAFGVLALAWTVPAIADSLSDDFKVRPTPYSQSSPGTNVPVGGVILMAPIPAPGPFYLPDEPKPQMPDSRCNALTPKQRQSTPACECRGPGCA